MKNIIHLALLTTGLAISLISATNLPAFASDENPADNLYNIFFLGAGPSVLSTNGTVQYGLQSKWPINNPNSHLRLGIHAGGGLATFSTGFTYGLGERGATIVPFVGGGLGLKIINVPSRFSGTTIDNAFALYGTGGVDLNFGNLSLTTAISLPTNSAYGTDYQLGVSFNF
jgi:hypothetical protein